MMPSKGSDPNGTVEVLGGRNFPWNSVTIFDKNRAAEVILNEFAFLGTKTIALLGVLLHRSQGGLFHG